MTFESVQSICLAGAAVFDTVLLLALLERRNWPFVRVPIVTTVAGAWLWHAGYLCALLLDGFPTSWAWYGRSAFMLSMAVGLLLMPCGLLHAAWRVWQDKIRVQERPQARHALCYLPLIIILPLAYRFLLFEPNDLFGRDRFFELTALAALFFAGLINVIAAGVLFSARRKTNLPRTGPFFLSMAAVLIGITVLQWFTVLAAHLLWPQGALYWILAVTLSPLLPALLFAYFIVRHNFLQIVLERSIVYGAILATVLLVHQLAFQDVSALMPAVYRVHVVYTEMIVLVGLVLIYHPLRQRTAEALRYLLGVRVSGIRDALRQLSRDLSCRAGQPVRDTVVWFTGALADALDVDYVAGWLFGAADDVTIRCGDNSRWPDDEAQDFYRKMRNADLVLCSRRHAADPALIECLQNAGAALAVVKARPNISGLLVIGRTRTNRELSEEETNAVLLLVEQLAITLDNSILEAERLAAERKAMQNEKLSALGLLASSIAHEVKNPLSAIKTIATVLAEDLGPLSPHAEDLRLILGEVERLAATTAQLLEIARPRHGQGAAGSVVEVLSSTLRLLRHVAVHQDITIETALPEDLPAVHADEHSLREILFNLVSNSLDAAGSGGRIAIHCQRENGYVVTEVRDSGPGIPPELRERLFEPFLTTKQTGTGLGLYLVGRRVGELGGVIRCDSAPERGTSFTVKLPTFSREPPASADLTEPC